MELWTESKLLGNALVPTAKIMEHFESTTQDCFYAILAFGYITIFFFAYSSAAVPKLWVATHWWVVGVIAVGRESHSKFKLLPALSQII